KCLCRFCVFPSPVDELPNLLLKELPALVHLITESCDGNKNDYPERKDRGEENSSPLTLLLCAVSFILAFLNKRNRLIPHSRGDISVSPLQVASFFPVPDPN